MLTSLNSRWKKMWSWIRRIDNGKHICPTPNDLGTYWNFYLLSYWWQCSQWVYMRKYQELMLNFSREFEGKLMKKWIWTGFEDGNFYITENMKEFIRCEICFWSYPKTCHHKVPPKKLKIIEQIWISVIVIFFSMDNNSKKTHVHQNRLS